MRNSSRTTRRQSWITAYRVLTTILIFALVAMVGYLLARPVPSIEIAEEVNGPSEFTRPSAMEYVAKTNSCVVGGIVGSVEWNVGGKAYDVGEIGVGEIDPKVVDYTAFWFRTDAGRIIRVSQSGALFMGPGESRGLQLYCDPFTMDTDESFGLISIIWGGR